MADISMCEGIGCPLKDNCHRYTAPQGHWQSWSPFWKDKECEYFWDNKGYPNEEVDDKD